MRLRMIPVSSDPGIALRSGYGVVRRTCVSSCGSILCSLIRLLRIDGVVCRVYVSGCGNSLRSLIRLLCGNSINCLQPGIRVVSRRRADPYFSRLRGLQSPAEYIRKGSGNILPVAR